MILGYKVVELFGSLSPVLRTFVQYLIAFCSWPEAVSDVISGRFTRLIVPNKCANFVISAQTILDKFHPKPSEAVFSTVFFRYNFQPKIDNDVIFGLAVDYVGMDVLVKFGDFRSNGSWDIWAADFMLNELMNEYDRKPII